MGVATAVRTAPETATTDRLVLLLSLSPSSKVIAKQHHVQRLPDVSGGEFQCRTCGRWFATFQALGGHRTSHKRPRVRAHGLDLLLGSCPGKGTVAVHRCHVCGTVFPTGQALGGHMRRHRVDFSAAMLETMATASGSSEEDDDDNVSNTLIQFI